MFTECSQNIHSKCYFISPAWLSTANMTSLSGPPPGGGMLTAAVSSTRGCAALHTRSISTLETYTFREHSGNIQGTSREYSVHIQGTFREHSGNIQGTFSALGGAPHFTLAQSPHSRPTHSCNIQGILKGTFSAHSGNIQRELSGCPWASIPTARST
jgi:hypothetical protein